MTLSSLDIFIISLIVAIINWASTTDILNKIDRVLKDTKNNNEESEVRNK